ncbi:glucosyl-3-phosphoglycerate synthase [Pseudonocardia sp. KRD291]|uniref:glucosyl-3-phosphoglycerate synthase n=1 Tax=Pseudonocardia sp. KRD291 TaxID=2792007 RepID=UPI001C4A110C|nr:glucosyl-3-phosphoglycerate synthase [Pseudonocardia sp. KRD291]MBW0106009.1 glucosyl-3-phosphoglycerate synthase [Pseudonocardia sp. KRD291]
MLPELEDWFARATWQDPRWDAASLSGAKAGRRVSVVLPALDEQDTVAAVVAAVLPLTRGPSPLVDELMVLDSGSTDATRRVAAEAGARVVSREEALPGVPARPGKGEVLWRSLAATTGDLVVFLDSDLVDVDTRFVTSLLGPLLTAPGVELVKGFYRRPLRLLSAELDTGGGRVTELLARPVITALCPRLAGVVQPLGGEYAATRDLLESLPFAAGYGVELGLLIDTERTRGLHALAQVNLGVRKHRNRSLLQLGVMSRQILAAVLNRVPVPDSGEAIVQFTQLDGQWLPTERPVETRDRPAMRELLSRRGGPAPR